MNFSQYCKGLHPKKLSGITSQGKLIGALFNAAGSNFFVPNPAYDTDSYQRKLYSGAKPLTQEMKDSFPKPLDTAGVTSFFDTRIGDGSLPQIMAAFNIPLNEPQNKALFITALCTQLQKIVADSSDDVNDIVASEYKRLLLENNTYSENLFPHYPGDDMLVCGENSESLYNVHCYEKFEHTWTIKNTGTVAWTDRVLVCVNQENTRVEALNSPVTISKVGSDNEISLVVQIDARGFEGVYESVWEIRDRDGNNCFPNKVELTLTVAVTYKRSSDLEVK